MKDKFYNFAYSCYICTVGNRKIYVAYKHSGEDRGKVKDRKQILTYCCTVYNRR